MKLQLLAAPLLVALILSPMFAAAASGTITFSSPTAGTALSGTATYTITGAVFPAPSLPDNVVITVTLQNGSPSPLDETTVAVGAGGSFTYVTNAGGSAAWVTGTYVITAFDSNGATGTTTFTYTASSGGGGGSSSSALVVYASSDSIVYAGQAVQFFATAYWTGNGTAAKAATWTATVWTPSGTASTVTWTASSPAAGASLDRNNASRLR